MFCSGCGKEIPENTQFCPNCGKAVNASMGDKFENTVNNFTKNVDSQFESSVNEIRNDFHGYNNNGYNNNGYNNNGYNNNGYNNNGYGGGMMLRTDRSLIMYILLSIITCGIYGYYFIYTIARDMNIACEGDGENTGGLASFILLSIITCGLYQYYWMYKIGNRIQANAPRYNLMVQENGTTILVWCILGLLLCGIGPIVGMYILIKNVNMLCAGYNRSHGM